MKKRSFMLVCALLLALLVAQSAFAMASEIYHLDWMNLLSASGGPASSAGYQADISVGQTVSGQSSSPAYKAQMGYWAGLRPPYNVFLAKVLKSP